MTKSNYFTIILFVFSIIFVQCRINDKPIQTDYRLEAFKLGELGWGYRIFKNDKSFIVQYTIPAIPNKISFSSKSDAEKTGVLMIEKLKTNQMPTVKISELDSLNISY